jgi:heme-degrading monooxygenase HmoA
MAYVSINRATIKPGAGAEFERVAEQWLRDQRERLPREELLSRQLVRADDRAEYAVISVWASKEAHERNEDSPAERGALGLIAGYLAAPPPAQFTGEVVVEAR